MDLLLAKLIELTNQKNRRVFSDSFIQTMSDFGLDIKQDNWENRLTGKYSPDFIKALLLIDSLWQQIQEDNLPFSYVKPQLSQKMFEQKITLAQKKLQKLPKQRFH